MREQNFVVPAIILIMVSMDLFAGDTDVFSGITVSVQLMSFAAILFNTASSYAGKIADNENIMSTEYSSHQGYTTAMSGGRDCLMDGLPARRIIRGEQGLTLIELMIVLILSLFLMASAYLTFQVQKRTGDVQQEVAAVQQDTRAVLDIMAKDVRQAGCDPMMTGTPGMDAAQCGPTQMSFSMDLNGDGDTADDDELVTYVAGGTSLTRNGVALSDRVTAFALTYYDADNAIVTPTGGGGASMTTAEAKSVRSVRVSLTLQSQKMDPDLNDFIRRTMTRELRMRNLGLF
jgi:prepilin-type N-terminal cleavage/methylation domain-containing protein